MILTDENFRLSAEFPMIPIEKINPPRFPVLDNDTLGDLLILLFSISSGDIVVFSSRTAK